MIWNARKKTKEKYEQLAEVNSYLEANAQRLYSYTTWVCGNNLVAGELMQRALKEVEIKIHSDNRIKSIRNYFHQALRAQCDKHKRRYEAQGKLKHDAGKVDTSKDAVKMVLEKVPEKYSQPLLMQVVGRFSSMEIADTLEIDESEVMVRLSAARRMISALAALEQTISPSLAHESFKMASAKRLHEWGVKMDPQTQLPA